MSLEVSSCSLKPFALHHGNVQGAEVVRRNQTIGHNSAGLLCGGGLPGNLDQVVSRDICSDAGGNESVIATRLTPGPN